MEEAMNPAKTHVGNYNNIAQYIENQVSPT